MKQREYLKINTKLKGSFAARNFKKKSRSFFKSPNLSGFKKLKKSRYPSKLPNQDQLLSEIKSSLKNKRPVNFKNTRNTAKYSKQSLNMKKSQSVQPISFKSTSKRGNSAKKVDTNSNKKYPNARVMLKETYGTLKHNRLKERLKSSEMLKTFITNFEMSMTQRRPNSRYILDSESKSNHKLRNSQGQGDIDFNATGLVKRSSSKFEEFKKRMFQTHTYLGDSRTRSGPNFFSHSS
jgi:hypothetical protein